MPPVDPSGLSALDGIVMRSLSTGRLRQWTMRDAAGAEMAALLSPTIILNDPTAIRDAAVLGLGACILLVSDVLPELENGTLVRLLPRWYADVGAISLYYAGRAFLPAKTRVFIDFVAESFRRQRLPERFAGSLGAGGAAPGRIRPAAEPAASPDG